MPANARSSYDGSSKPTLNVASGASSDSRINATTALESTPPLRKAPTGTSAIRWRRTAASSAAATSSGASTEGRSSGRKSRSQYRCSVSDPRSSVSVCAAGSLRTSRKGVREEDRRRVGGREEPLALLLQRLPILGVVVELSSVDDGEAGALYVHRLAAGGSEIDDAQPSVRHPDRRLHPESFVVGAAMTKRIDHALHAGRVRGTTVEQDYPADAAHRLDGAPSPTRARSRARTSQCPRRRSEEAACASRAPFTVRHRHRVAPV